MEGIDALMVGRGALIKPWIFEEFSSGCSIEPAAEDRIVIYHRLSQYFKEHFGADEYGKRHSFYFLPWHFGFFCRYRPLPEILFRDMAINAPLIQNTRLVDDFLKSSPLSQRDQLWSQAPLEKLLRSDDTAIHMQISELLWGSLTSEDAVASLRAFAIKADADGIFSNRFSDSTLRKNQNDAASTWEVGGTGPRGDPKNSSRDGTLALSTLSFSDSPNPKSRLRTDSSRWVPLSPEEHMKVLDFRVGVVLNSTLHPNADNLAINRVDLGATLGVRTIITGRADKTASMIGKKLAVLVNLKPRLLFNVKSEGLILSARGHALKETNGNDYEQEITWGPVFAPDDCKPGEPITCSGIQVIGHEDNNKVSPNRVQRAFKAVAEINLCTTDSGLAVFSGSGDKDKPSGKVFEMKVASGPCFSPIANGKIS
jgi:tRNA-binding EMAP/Myf-like protein